MDIGRPAAVRGAVDGGVVHQFVLQVHNRLRAPDEEDGIAVVQGAYLIGGQQFAATLLKIGGIGAGTALALPVGLGVDGGLAQCF